ncbi:MAG: hypothetical protein K8I82_03470 [Anaerolineae bacterium]|nr:hypothetical protein [Anaerolineae bacterium]
MVEPIKGENYEATFDVDEGIGYITYRGTLTPEATETVYHWLKDSLQNAPQESLGQIKGGVFDFSQVQDFAPPNLPTAHRKGRKFRREMGQVIVNIPVAMLVKTPYQEAMVWASIKLAKQENDSRVKVVKSLEQAKEFITQWQRPASV